MDLGYLGRSPHQKSHFYLKQVVGLGVFILVKAILYNGDLFVNKGDHFWYPPRGATAAEEFPAESRPPIPSRPGIKYPVRATPHSDILGNAGGTESACF